MDLYTEQLYKKRKRPLDWFLQGLTVAGLVLICMVQMVFFRAIAPQFGLMTGTLIIIVLAYFAYKYQWFLRFDKEFEYLYFNGDIDIDQITAKSTRKRLLSVRAADVQRFGVYRDAVKTNAAFDKIIDVTSGYAYEDTTLCFLTLHDKELGHTLLLFEPKKEILDDMKRRVTVPFES